MAFTMKVRGPNGKTVDLTPEQFAIVEPIVVSMMNAEIGPKDAEKQVIAKLKEAGKPVIFGI